MNSQMTSVEALGLLIEGNERFSAGLRSVEIAMSVAKMKELAENGQAPFAIVLTCSDSRVPTEMLFDRGLGDIFVIRIAGNVVSPMVTASVEYAAQVLGSTLCVVMGHSGCGAIATALKLENDKKGQVEKSLTRDLSTLISAIRPAVREAKRLLGESAPHETCVHETTMANIRHSVNLLNESAVISDYVEQGKLATIGAIYDLHTGVVRFDDHPLLNALLSQDHSRSIRPTETPGQSAASKQIILAPEAKKRASV